MHVYVSCYVMCCYIVQAYKIHALELIHLKFVVCVCMCLIKRESAENAFRCKNWALHVHIWFRNVWNTYMLFKSFTVVPLNIVMKWIVKVKIVIFHVERPGQFLYAMCTLSCDIDPLHAIWGKKPRTLWCVWKADLCTYLWSWLCFKQRKKLSFHAFIFTGERTDH